MDFIARYGGEEFVLVINDVGIYEALRVVQRLKDNIAATQFFIDSTKEYINLTISIGLSQYNLGEQITALINRADKALYMAKTNRNTIMIEQ